MGVMAEIDLERQASLTEAVCNHMEAISEYMMLLDKYPIAYRTVDQMKEVDRAFFRAEYAHMQRDKAERERYRL